jgi:hypothetical protein
VLADLSIPSIDDRHASWPIFRSVGRSMAPASGHLG